MFRPGCWVLLYCSSSLAQTRDHWCVLAVHAPFPNISWLRKTRLELIYFKERFEYVQVHSYVTGVTDIKN